MLDLKMEIVVNTTVKNVQANVYMIRLLLHVLFFCFQRYNEAVIKFIVTQKNMQVYTLKNQEPT